MRVLSGMRPTGKLHLGNYLGALVNWLDLQKKYQCFFMVADYHALTTLEEIKNLKKDTLDMVIDWLAAGIDPKKSVVFLQSEINEHTELAWIFNCLTLVSSLLGMTQFKEKSKEQPRNINAGLFTYPVLQAADILIYKANLVPVGEDQKQHVEFTREIARKFNNLFGKTFPEPEVLLTETPRIMSLLHLNKKMSKSLGEESYLAISDSPEVIWKKLGKAVTDPARKRITDKGNPKRCPLFTLHKYFSKEKEINEVSDKCRKALFGCLDCKRILAKNISEYFKEFREKRKELEKNPKMIENILKEGAKRARKLAQETIKEVKSKLNLAL